MVSFSWFKVHMVEVHIPCTVHCTHAMYIYMQSCAVNVRIHHSVIQSQSNVHSLDFNQCINCMSIPVGLWYNHVHVCVRLIRANEVAPLLLCCGWCRHVTPRLFSRESHSFWSIPQTLFLFPFFISSCLPYFYYNTWSIHVLYSPVVTECVSEKVWGRGWQSFQCFM